MHLKLSTSLKEGHVARIQAGAVLLLLATQQELWSFERECQGKADVEWSGVVNLVNLSV